MVQNTNIPITSIDNPFPSGLLQPTATHRPGVGASSSISFFDPNATAPRVQQYSVDLQRELPGGLNVGIGYVGSRADHLNFNSRSISTNCRPTICPWPPTHTLVPNPFFGVAGAGSLATQATVQLNSLLVPYPQYGLNAVSMTTAGAHSSYNAAVLQASQARERLVGR
jgi:hypothetical protein